MIRRYNNASFAEARTLFAAYVQCLSPEEGCDLLIMSLSQKWDVRRVALRKVCADMEERSSATHRELLRRLTDGLRQLDLKQRRKTAYCCIRMAVVAPPADRLRVLRSLLRSSQAGLRRLIYSALSKGAFRLRLRTIEVAWRQFRDPECAALMIDRLSVKDLVRHRVDLMKTLKRGWRVGRMYLRIGQSRSDLVEELREADPISYCYVRAKLNMPITEADACRIVRKHFAHEKLSLLIWALGRMKLRGALDFIRAHERSISRAQLRRALRGGTARDIYGEVT